MISGNKREFDQWVFMFIYDLYSICSEVAVEDPTSMYKQLPKIKAPMFVAFGAQEPFIPGTALNGLQDLGNDIIKPFMKRMTAAGNKPVLKVYPGVGHFIHTDVPYEFARDTVDFMRNGPRRRGLARGRRNPHQGRAGWRRRRRCRRQAHRAGQVGARHETDSSFRDEDTALDRARRRGGPARRVRHDGAGPAARGNSDGLAGRSAGQGDHREPGQARGDAQLQRAATRTSSSATTRSRTSASAASTTSTRSRRPGATAAKAAPRSSRWARARCRWRTSPSARPSATTRARSSTPSSSAPSTPATRPTCTTPGTRASRPTPSPAGRSSGRAGRSTPTSTTWCSSTPSGCGARPSRRTGWAASSRSTTTWTWWSPTSGCCAIT